MPTESFVRSSARLLTVAKNIDRLLSEVVAHQQDHVEEICSECETPCCGRVGYLFDEKDLVFARVMGLNGLSRKKRKGKRGCPYLSPTGCVLGPKSRPFACHRYLCQRLKVDMDRRHPGFVSKLNKKLRTLEKLRGELLAAYIQVQGVRGGAFWSHSNA